MRETLLTPVTDANLALQALKDGNKRFVEGKPSVKDDVADRKATAGGQKPYAIILTCADSRCSPEIYFDQRIGEIFVLRNAGNFATDVELGSMEFATLVLGAPLVVVVGHAGCGAVDNALKNTPGLPPALAGVLDNIKPGIAGSADLRTATDANAKKVVETIKANNAIKDQGIKVVPAYYDFETGVVSFLD